MRSSRPGPAPLVAGYRFVTLAAPLVLGPGTYTVWGDAYDVDANYNHAARCRSHRQRADWRNHVRRYQPIRLGECLSGHWRHRPGLPLGAVSFVYAGSTQILPLNSEPRFRPPARSTCVTPAKPWGTSTATAPWTTVAPRHTLTLAGGNFTGVITDSGTSTLSLVKTSAGTLTLSGAGSNTYTGVTTLSGTGQLILSKTGGAVAIPADINMSATGRGHPLGDPGQSVRSRIRHALHGDSGGHAI